MNKLDPTRSMYLRGFDRRGCTASLNNTTSSGLTVSGYFSDLADFVVLMLYDADDVFGHLYTSKYLPDFTMTGVILDFDLSIVNCQNPISWKYPSVPWNQLSYILEDGTSGAANLNVTSITGGAAASCLYTVNGSINAGDRIQLIYLGNILFDHIVATGDTASSVASSLAYLINNYDYVTASAIPLTAIWHSDATFTVTTKLGRDGNSFELLELHTSNTTYLTPAGTSKLIGGLDPTSIHIQIDFHALNIENLRQAWFTISPTLPYDSGSVNPCLVAYESQEFSWIISNIVVSGATPLKVAAPGSIVLDCRDKNVTFSGNWDIESGFYCKGFAKGCSSAGNTVTCNYYCMSTHNIYLGTALYGDRGIFSITVDGVAQANLNCYLNVSSQLITRRLIASSISAGWHTVVLTSQNSNRLYFDYLHAAILGDPIAPAETYNNCSTALDFDTDQTYKLSPARSLWLIQQLGFKGDIDVYTGVFFALKRRRRGGYFHSAVCTISGSWNNADDIFITISTTTFGAGFTTGLDTNDTLKQRCINAINAIFVGVRAYSSGTGQFTVISLTPINGFAISISTSTGAIGSFTITGDVLAGNEGIWEVDPTQTLPLNKGFINWLTDFTNLTKAASLTFSLAFSQELLAPPDENTSAGAWIQRFSDSSTVLTATAFGIWGLGYVSTYTGIVTQYGHGYISGNIVTIVHNGVQQGIWTVDVLDNDHYTLTNYQSGSGPGGCYAGDTAYINLQTSQCAFNPLTVTPYLSAVYTQAASLINTLGVTPWLQFGEILHWFFANTSSMAYYDMNQMAAATSALGRSLYVFTDPNNNPNVNSYADANFLRQRLQTHVNSIRTNVLSSVSTAKFELLWPDDVNWNTAFTNTTYPYYLGGQLNRYVNLPLAYYSPGSDIDRIKMEALAWGTSYRDLDNAKASIEFPFTVGTWPRNNVKYILPWDNGGCPWQNELRLALSENIDGITLWAMDHITLLSWPLPLPLKAAVSEVY